MAIKKTQTTPAVGNWWEAETDDEMCRGVFDTLTHLEKQNKWRREKNLLCLRLYANLDIQGLGPFAYVRTNTEALPENRVKMNLIASCIDTAAAKISKMKPKITFLTSGGDFSLREKARKLQKFILGTFYSNKVHELHQGMFKDSLIFDIGAIKHFIQGKKIVSERVLPTEIYVDTADAMYGKPSQMFHVKFVSKEALAKEYPDDRAAIFESACQLDSEQNLRALDEEDDFVIVMEAWRLGPNGKKNGLHTICTNKVMLHKEKYKYDYFPFTFDRWTPPSIGFYGQSLAERLIGNQIEINKMLRVIQRAFHLGSAFKVFLEYGSKVSREHINNDVGSIVYFSGQAPTYYTPQTVHPEYFEHLRWLIQSCYDEVGISQLSASSKIPIGMDGGSGKALREYNDLESERFVLQAQEYESSFLTTARIYIDLAREIGDYETVAESKRFIESINWEDIALENNEFLMQMFPTSMLPQTPAGRLAYVRELLQDGMIDQSFALSLLEFPDIEGYTSLKTAPLDDILDTLERVLYHGEYLTPEPFQNLELGVEIFQMAYLRARKDKAPDERLEDMRRWIEQAQAMLDQSKALQANPTAGLPAGMLLNASNPMGALPGAPAGGGLPTATPNPQTQMSVPA